MAFDVAVDDHHVTIDSTTEHGGRGLGPTPKPLLLASLGGCAGMDIVSILTKMRVPLRGFSVDVEGDTADEHPMRFDKVRVAYRIGGDDLPLSKVRRAIALTEEKYCGVWATLAPAVTLESTLFVNGEEVPPGED
jgi:putative redox protein